MHNGIFIKLILFLLGVFVLANGVGFYQSCRSDISISPVLNYLSFPQILPCSSSISGVFPTFTHQLALSFISASLSQSLNLLKSSVVWFVINVTCELSQLISSDVPFLPRPLNNFLVNGRFDIADVSSLFIALTIAILIHRLIQHYLYPIFQKEPDHV